MHKKERRDMLKRIIFSLLSIFSIAIVAEMDNFNGDVSFSKPYMLVSLGHNCWQAQATRKPEEHQDFDAKEGEIERSSTRYHGLRDAAFPFDWLFTLNVDKLVLCLDEHFEHFLDESCFVRDGDQSHLTNVYYDFKFTHDWPFHWATPVNDERHRVQLDYIKEKYSRRIARFNSLKNYKGKVFFMRSFEYATDYQHSPRKIQDALKRYFPDLNFTLVIVNRTNISIFQWGPVEGVVQHYRPDDLTAFGAYDVIFNDLLKDLR
jgi:hypothetical protein